MEAVEACRRLEDELVALRSIVQSIQFQKNTFASIHRLPPEIIIQCFWFVLHLEPPTFRDSEEDIPRKSWIGSPKSTNLKLREIGWIKVRESLLLQGHVLRKHFSSLADSTTPRYFIQLTHVCRHWRQIAISHHAFWATFTEDLPEDLYQTMVDRSGDAPLIVNQDVDTPKGRDRADNLVSNHFSHIKHLTLRGSVDALGTVAEHFSDPAPQLELIDLNCTKTKGSNTGRILQKSSFSGEAARLQDISLKLLAFPEASSILQNVTRFCYELEERNPALPSLDHLQCDQDDMLQVLDCMPTLEILRLHHCYLHTSDTDSMLYRPPSRLVKLFSLQVLDLRNTYVACIVTLKGLRIPSSARILLEFHSYIPRTTEETVPLLNVALIALDDIVTGHLPTLRALRINVGNDFNSSISARGRMLSILGWRTPISEDHIPDFDTEPAMAGTPPDIALELKLGARPLKCRDLLQKVFGYWDMRTVDTLSVRFPNRSTGAEFWYDLALHFKNIRHLSVEVSKLNVEIMRLILLGRNYMSISLQVHPSSPTPPASPSPNSPMPTFDSLHFPLLAVLAFRDHTSFAANWCEGMMSALKERKGKDGAFALKTLCVPGALKASTAEANLDELRNLGMAVKLRG